MNLNYCPAEEQGPLNLALILGGPVVVLLVGYVIWKCYGEVAWKPAILQWRDNFKSRFLNSSNH